MTLGGRRFLVLMFLAQITFIYVAWAQDNASDAEESNDPLVLAQKKTRELHIDFELRLQQLVSILQRKDPALAKKFQQALSASQQDDVVGAMTEAMDTLRTKDFQTAEFESQQIIESLQTILELLEDGLSGKKKNKDTPEGKLSGLRRLQQEQAAQEDLEKLKNNGQLDRDYDEMRKAAEKARALADELEKGAKSSDLNRVDQLSHETKELGECVHRIEAAKGTQAEKEIQKALVREDQAQFAIDLSENLPKGLHRAAEQAQKDAAAYLRNSANELEGRMRESTKSVSKSPPATESRKEIAKKNEDKSSSDGKTDKSKEDEKGKSEDRKPEVGKNSGEGKGDGNGEVGGRSDQTGAEGKGCGSKESSGAKHDRSKTSNGSDADADQAMKEMYSDFEHELRQLQDRQRNVGRKTEQLQNAQEIGKELTPKQKLELGALGVEEEEIAEKVKALKKSLDTEESAELDSLSEKLSSLSEAFKKAKIDQDKVNTQKGVESCLGKLRNKMHQSREQLETKIAAKNRTNSASTAHKPISVSHLPGEDTASPSNGAKSAQIDTGNNNPNSIESGEWAPELPPRDREQILQLLKEKFPERYKGIVEQYYKSIATDQKR